MNKYRNKPVSVDGEHFASRKELRRWRELELLQRAGKISQLRRQPRYKLIVAGQLICAYVADADYLDVESGVLIVEDVKSPVTRKHPVYRIKKKLMAACHRIEVKEV